MPMTEEPAVPRAALSGMDIKEIPIPGSGSRMSLHQFNTV